ncbi:MAG TPA: lysine--tRNA ligase, partial [Alphaproteobacteria bacterium]|nr:lysine--tRNA ligase [Alphaproteobacteria bacterium]
FFDVIPKSMDDYLSHKGKFPTQDPIHQHDNPVWHIHSGKVEALESQLSYSLLLNLASVCNADDPKILWGFVSRYESGATPQTHPYLDHLIGYAVRYYQDFVKPLKVYKEPDEVEVEALKDLRHELKIHDISNHTADTLQAIVFEVGKRHPFADLKQWFGSLYEILLGQKEGPRMGSFMALYGVEETIKLIEEKILAD